MRRERRTIKGRIKIKAKNKDRGKKDVDGDT